jgi:RNA polymerase sigma-70 factor (ECF subfamily)
MALPHLDGLYRLACRLTARRAEAEDLVQETFIEAQRGFPALRDPGRCRAWMFRILRNLWFHQRQKERARAAFGATELAAGREGVGDLEREVMALGFSDEVESALRQLPEEFRTAIVLVAVEELTYEEVSEIMDCPIGTVRSRVARGRSLLTAMLIATPANRRKGRS